MKIIYIANARIPTEKAHGKQIVKTCEALASEGVDVELWVPKRKQTKNLASADPFVQYRSHKNFQIKYFNNIDLLYFGRSLPSLFQGALFFLQQMTFALAIFTGNRSNSIIYTRSQIVGCLMTLVSDQKIFYEAHDLSKSPLIRKIARFFFKRMSGVIVISKGLFNDYKKLGSQKLLLAPDAFDPKEFGGITKNSARKKLLIPISSNVAVYAGSFQKEKGVETIIASAKRLVGKINFILVGDNTNFNSPGEVPTNVRFTGQVNPKLVPQYLKAADLLLLPNSALHLYSQKYTSPMKLFEYLGSGVPILATRTEANQEILNETNALLVSPDDPEEMAQVISQSLMNKQRSHQLASKALMDSRRYTWSKRAQKIIEFVS